MTDSSDIEEVKKITEELLAKMQAEYLTVAAASNTTLSPAVIEIDIKLREPQMFIGQGGQSLMSLQRIAGIIAGRRLKKTIYLQLDINDYKKEKITHLKTMAREAADEVARTKLPKTLPPMASYERRIVHTELAQRADVFTRSVGEGDDRSITISPR